MLFLRIKATARRFRSARSSVILSPADSKEQWLVSALILGVDERHVCEPNKSENLNEVGLWKSNASLGVPFS